LAKVDENRGKDRQTKCKARRECNKHQLASR
jgi:hypothetical protein